MLLTLRTDAELDRALTALAAAEGVSKEEVIRRAVLDRYERTARLAAAHDAAVDDVAARPTRDANPTPARGMMAP